jgi:dihydrolipoamide dehydrogenase
MRTCDLAIVGAGPGGYVAALRAAQLGMKVCLIERDALGGVCLNRGCIPTKAMLQTAALLDEFRHAQKFGVTVTGEVTVDYPAAVARRDGVVAQLTKGVQGLLKHAGVDVVYGTAAFTGPTSLAVTLRPAASDGAGTSGDSGAADAEEAVETVAAAHIMIATGSKPVRFPVPGADLAGVIDSDGALALRAVPSRLLVVGGGAVGCEWSTVFSRFGSQVTLVEMLPTLLPRVEPELSRILTGTMTKGGITVHTGTSVAAVTQTADGLLVALTGAHAGTVVVDNVLVAAGRGPLTEGLDLPAAGVATDGRGWIPVDRYQRTNIPSVLAIGDVTGRALLAHVASRQGIVAVEKLAGLIPDPVRDDRIPAVTYTDPEVASVGLTEADARERGLTVQIGTFPFAASGRALASGVQTGLVKIVADCAYGRVLGVHLIGAHVGELLAEAALALDLEATVDELSAVIRAHPTLSETIGEAALAVRGHALHVVERKDATPC